jgi:hypothetical protein
MRTFSRIASSIVIAAPLHYGSILSARGSEAAGGTDRRS